MGKANLNRKAIFEIFDLEQSGLYDVNSPGTGPIDQEELSGRDIDTLTDILCDGEYDIFRYYSKFVEIWGGLDDDYKLIMSNQQDDNELTISTYLSAAPGIPEVVEIHRDEHFTSIDLFNIISAINSQIHFHDLYIAVEKDSDLDSGVVNGTVYHEESFAIYKTWIGDLMDMFRNGEIDNFHSVRITSDFDELDLDPINDLERANRLYVRFYLHD